MWSLPMLFELENVDQAGRSLQQKSFRLETGVIHVRIKMPSIAETWGTEPQERSLAFPCDGIISQPDAALYRGITIAASPKIVFRWLCQMRAAPYSYDWIDNGGRQSPNQLTPNIDNLAIGQDVMRIFNLVSFERDVHLTLRMKIKSEASRTFGDIAVSYVIVADGQDHLSNRCRLLAKVIAKYPPGLKGELMRALLPWGDLIMMRRQLLTFKRLAEAAEKETND